MRSDARIAKNNHREAHRALFNQALTFSLEGSLATRAREPAHLDDISETNWALLGTPGAKTPVSQSFRPPTATLYPPPFLSWPHLAAYGRIWRNIDSHFFPRPAPRADRGFDFYFFLINFFRASIAFSSLASFFG
jgi:hypothetical protein